MPNNSIPYPGSSDNNSRAVSDGVSATPTPETTPAAGAPSGEAVREPAFPQTGPAPTPMTWRPEPTHWQPPAASNYSPEVNGQNAAGYGFTQGGGLNQQQRPKRKKSPVALIIAGLLAVSGIAYAAGYRPAETPAAAPSTEQTVFTPAEEPPVNEYGLTDAEMDGLYLDVLAEGGVTFTSDAAAIEAGHAVCDSFDAGLTFEDIVTVGINSGSDAGDVGYTVGVAVGAYCPEHTTKIGG